MARGEIAPCHTKCAHLPCAALNDATPPFTFLEGHCAREGVCPLNQVKAGTEVCVRELLAAHDVRDRLRELGLGEDQRVRLVSRDANVICQVCNARIGLSEELASTILVEPLAETPGAK